jgi:hypothetical protein
VKILWEKVRQYVELLSQTETLEQRFNEWNVERTKSGRPLVDRAVLDPLLAADGSLFVRDAQRAESFKWRYDRYGVDVFRQAGVRSEIQAGVGVSVQAKGTVTTQPPPTDPIDVAMDLIDTFAGGLAGLTL